MRFVISLVLSFALAASFFFDSFRSAEAAAKIKTYPNCTALNKEYPGGAARSASVKNKGGGKFIHFPRPISVRRRLHKPPFLASFHKSDRLPRNPKPNGHFWAYRHKPSKLP